MSDKKMVDPLRECFTVTKSGNGEYRIVMQFPTLADMQAGHQQLIDLLAKPAEQHQGHPAWYEHTLRNERGNPINQIVSEHADQPFGKPDVDYDKLFSVSVVPLYKHADPAEALNDLDDAKEACAEIEHTGTPGDVIREMNDELVDLRAQLAERDALLRDALASHGVMLMTDPPQDPWKTRRIAERIAAALFGSLEATILKWDGKSWDFVLQVNGITALSIRSDGVMDAYNRYLLEQWMKAHQVNISPIPSLDVSHE